MTKLPHEIAQFNQTDWWDPNGSFATLHHINPTRIDFILLHTAIEGKKIADLGCGGGILTNQLAKMGGRLSGIDLAPEALNAAKIHAEQNDLNIDYHLSSIEEYASCHPEEYDFITCMEMLEHVPDPKNIIQSAKKLLKPGGILFLSTLNRSIKAYFSAIVAAEYLLKIVPKNTHDYQKFITPAELVTLCREEDLSLIALKGLSYNPFTKTSHLNEDPSINYLLCVQKDH